MGNQTWITPVVKQWWCASSVLICIAAQGFAMGHTASLLFDLIAKDSPIKVDIGMATSLAAIPTIACLFGIAGSCFLMDWLGRRTSYVISIIPGVGGWAMLYLAQSYIVILMGRILIATTSGAVGTIGIVMIGECASPQHRGMFLNLKSTGVSLGSAIAHILGNFMHWRCMSIVALVPNLISLAIALTWPESPSWLASRKQYDKCKKEFFWLRGVSDKSVREVTELIESQKERFSHPKKDTAAKIKAFFKKFTEKDFLKPLFIITVAFVVMEASGRHYFPTYALQITNEFAPSKSSAHYYTLCIDIIVTASTMVSAVLMRVAKVRTLLFVSGIGALVVLVFLCTILYLTSIDVISTYPWFITCLFVLYFAFENLGCGPLPLTLQGEIFPLAHKEIGISVLGVFFCVILMGTLKVIPHLLLTIKVYGTLAVFGIVMAVCLLIIYFTLPETKDKTLLEIENFFKYGKYRIDNDPDELYSEMLIKDDQRRNVTMRSD